MHKKVKTSVSQLRSWDEVDQALREICECDIAIENIQANMNMAINDAKLKAEKLAKPMKTAVVVLEAQIKDYVESNKSEIVGKSRELNFGSVGFRRSSKITYSAAKTDEVLAALKARGWLDCVSFKESVNKDVLKLKTDKELATVGVKRKTTDDFYYDIDREKIT